MGNDCFSPTKVGCTSEAQQSQNYTCEVGGPLFVGYLPLCALRKILSPTTWEESNGVPL